MSAIGFVGLGVMGRPMAANLVAAGHSVKGFSRTQPSRDAAAALGVPLVDSVREAAESADLVITMLPDSPDVESVALGRDGVLASLPAGADYIDMSSVSPTTARLVHGKFGDQGHGVLDAPVSGGEVAAHEAALSIMVGGDVATFEKWKDVLSAMGSTVVHVGDAGAGQVVKAANQLIVAGHLQMLAEGIVFLEAQGVDVGVALSVVAKGLGGSTVIDRKAVGALRGEYEPGFRTELHHKDLGIVQREARESGVSLPVTSLVAQFVQAIVSRGGGTLDHSSLVAFAREINAS